MQFSLYDALAAGTQIGSTVTKSGVTVTNGLFTTELDFGASPFAGEKRYLEIAVKCGVDAGYTTLAPRQQLTAVPYAVYAPTAENFAGNLAGDVTGTQSSTTVEKLQGYDVSTTAPSNGQVLKWNGTEWAPANESGSGNAWLLTGNSGTNANTNFVGTTDDISLTLRVNNVIGWRMSPQSTNTPNLIGGSSNNSMTSGVIGATIGGGGASGNANRVTDDYSVIGGGYNNQAGDNAGTTNDATHATIGGGFGNIASGTASVVAGGQNNLSSGDFATILGGEDNTASEQYAAIGGGGGNAASGSGSVIGGGFDNTASSNYSTVAGGKSNQATSTGATIGGGELNQVTETNATVSGGYQNIASGVTSTIGGGDANSASGESSFIGGGHRNNAQNQFTTIGGGDANSVEANFATIGGGQENLTGGSYAFIGGGGGNSANGGFSAIGGGRNNQVDGADGTIAGGGFNLVDAAQATIGGGEYNEASGSKATIGGGGRNTASEVYATVSGGDSNTASNTHATVAGGYGNTAEGSNAVVSGGDTNLASGSNSIVIGGFSNVAGGDTSVVLGGDNNSAKGDGSVVAGHRAKSYDASDDTILYNNTFLFADGSNFDFFATGDNQFRVRSTGGAQIVTAIDGSGNDAAGVEVASGGGSWSSLSDRNAKQNFSQINPREILQRVAQMPILKWNYKTQDASVKHIGPMAQDFYAAFNVGENEKHITTIDADGVSLAAIQGLNEIVTEQSARLYENQAQLARQEKEIRELREINASLQARLTALEQSRGGDANNWWMFALGAGIVGAGVWWMMRRDMFQKPVTSGEKS